MTTGAVDLIDSAAQIDLAIDRYLGIVIVVNLLIDVAATFNIDLLMHSFDFVLMLIFEPF